MPWGMSDATTAIAGISELGGALGGALGDLGGGEPEVTVQAQEEAAAAAGMQAGGWPEPLPGLQAPPPPVAVIGALPAYAVPAGIAWLDAWFISHASELLRLMAAAQTPQWRVF